MRQLLYIGTGTGTDIGTVASADIGTVASAVAATGLDAKIGTDSYVGLALILAMVLVSSHSSNQHLIFHISFTTVAVEQSQSTHSSITSCCQAC